MPRIFIIDHSLKRPGGHHLDYTLLVAQAAVDQGLETVVGTHRKFKLANLFPHSCQIRNVFRKTTYSPLAHFQKVNRLTGKIGSDPAKNRVAFSLAIQKQSQWRRGWEELCWRRQVATFTQDLHCFFQDVRFQDTDRVFLPTTSEIDLEGLAAFLKANGRSYVADWHLQFHFNLFAGRTPDYDCQEEFVAETRQRLLSAMKQIQRYRVRFWVTSDTLSEQFEKLQIGPISELTYPIDPDFLKRQNSQRRGQTLRVTCAGGVRQEKGQQSLCPLLRSLWDDFIKPEKIKFIVQRKPRSRMRRQQVELHNGGSHLDLESLEAAIEWVPHPLPKEDYAELIRTTDIGLLMYDSHVYFSRRAGVLGEYLTAGKPVMVPAGCWLAEQIAEPNFVYVQQLLTAAQKSNLIRVEQANWRNNAAAQLGQLVVGQDAALQPNGFIPTQGRSSGLVLGFDFLEPAARGYYLKITVSQQDQYGNTISQEVQVTGRRKESGQNLVYVRLQQQTHDVSVSFSNAYEDSLLLLSDISVYHLLDHSANARQRPLGAVGLIAADLEQVPRLLSDLVENYEHYRHSADAFSGQWFDRHDPAETVRQLIIPERMAAAA